MYLSKHHNHLDPRCVLVTEDVIHEGGAGIPAQVRVSGYLHTSGGFSSEERGEDPA